MASVAQELLMCSQIRAARSLVQCSRALYRSGLFIGSRVKACRQNIADSVARVIQRILEGPTAAAMFSTRVSKGTILRTLACAMDLLDKSDCVSRVDEHLTALALVRLSVKLELYNEPLDIALKLLGHEEQIEKKTVLSLECGLVMALWSEGESHILETLSRNKA
jgi:hypothetical protein